MPSEMKRLKQLEDEKGTLKKIVAELSLDKTTLQDVLRRKLRGLVDGGSWWTRCGARKVSIRRACRVLQTDSSTYHYKGRRGDQAMLGKRIREIAQTRVHYGYRRIHVLLRRQDRQVNAKRVYRIYRDQGSQLRYKVPSAGSRPGCATVVLPRSEPMKHVRWTSCMTSWRPDASCGC